MDLPPTHSKSAQIQPFGTVLGITDGGVEAYSCDYDSADRSKYSNRESYQMIYNGIYTGYKFQCVEIARRYLVVNHGVVFESIPMAYDIFDLRTVKRVANNGLLYFKPHVNGEAKVIPIKGNLLIWEPMGEFTGTGHVAVIVNAGPDFVDIVEQNVEDALWAPGTNYSRRLRAKVSADGSFEVFCDYGKGGNKILGWMSVSFDELYVYEDIKQCRIADLKRTVFDVEPCVATKPWLDKSDQADKAFIEAYGENLLEVGGKSGIYYTIPETAHTGLAQATRELHDMFLKSTERVLHDDALLKDSFRIPEKLWQKLRYSWYRGHRDIISARFDFTLTDAGVKCYEYNADSASCLMECGYTQARWADAIGIGHIGRNSSDNLFPDLVATWKARKVDGTLHMMRDLGDEENYHTMYMKNAAEKAGIKCKVIVGVEGLRFAPSGEVLDPDGEQIKTVWKTWSWQTVLNQLQEKDLLEFLVETEKGSPTKRDTKIKPRLIDVLLHDKVRVFEPLWTIIPACKAILPVLCEMYPECPYLIKSSFELTPDLIKTGYVTKPVTGRGGGNVSLFDQQGKIIEQTPGKWTNDKEVFQELCPLPLLAGNYVQVCTWTVKGEYAGTVLRVDKSKIIGYESNCYSLRIVPDEVVK